jgi:hypothetical protein
VAETAHAGGAILKVIFENAYLTDEEKVRACRLTEAAGGDFVKTSTGFGPGGATHDDLRLMRANTSPAIRVKAAGGVRTLDALLAVMDLGRIVQVGSPSELYNRPIDVFVARLLGPTNLLQGQVESPGGDLRGEVVVRTPLGRLIGQSGPGAPGQGTPVTISVRPETLAVGPTVPAGWNRFPATIERIVFRGDLRQIHARGPGDWPITVSVFQSQSQGLREGQSLTLSVAPEHVVVLPGKFALGKPLPTGGPEPS